MKLSRKKLEKHFNELLNAISVVQCGTTYHLKKGSKVYFKINPNRIVECNYQLLQTLVNVYSLSHSEIDFFLKQKLQFSFNIKNDKIYFPSELIILDEDSFYVC